MIKLLRLARPRVDANDGELHTNNPSLGNREHGTAVFLTGVVDVLPTTDAGTHWDAYESITVSTTAVSLAASSVNEADHDMVTIDVEGGAIRFRVDGVTAPVAAAAAAAAGRIAEVGDIIKLTSASEVANFAAIRRDGTDATLRVTYGHRETD